VTNDPLRALVSRWTRSPTLTLWTGNAASILLRFALSVLMARLAGVRLYGLFAIATMYSAILARAVDLGATNGLSFIAKAEPESTLHLLRISALHSLIAAPIVFALFAGVAQLPFGDPDSNNLFHHYSLAATALCTSQLFNGLTLSLLVPLQRYAWYGIASAASPLISMGVILTFAATDSIGEQQLLLAAAAGEAAAAFITVATILRYAQRPSAPRSAMAAARSLYAYSIRSFPGQLLKFGGQRADRLLLASLLPPAAVGVYSLAVSLRDQALTPINLHALVVRNKFIELLQVRNDAAAARVYLWQQVKVTLMAAAPLAVVASVAAPFIIPTLYGRDFQSTGGVAAILFLTIPFIAVSNSGWSLVLAAGRPALFSILFTCATAIMLAALAIGVGLNELSGVAWANLAATGLATAMWSMTAVFLLRRQRNERVA